MYKTFKEIQCASLKECFFVESQMKNEYVEEMFLIIIEPTTLKVKVLQGIKNPRRT